MGIILLTIIELIYILTYVFIRNNYFKIANGVLNITFISIIGGVCYIFFSDIYVSNDVVGYILAVIFSFVGYYIFEKRRNNYFGNIYTYFQNFNEAIWFINDLFIGKKEDIDKIKDNIINVLDKLLKIKGTGMVLLSVSNKERKIRCILIFSSIYRMQTILIELSKDLDVKKFTIANKGFLTLECSF